MLHRAENCRFRPNLHFLSHSLPVQSQVPNVYVIILPTEHQTRCAADGRLEENAMPIVNSANISVLVQRTLNLVDPRLVDHGLRVAYLVSRLLEVQGC